MKAAGSAHSVLISDQVSLMDFEHPYPVPEDHDLLVQTGSAIGKTVVGYQVA